MPDMPRKSSFVISLRIRHPHVDPAEISHELGWQPRLIQKVGERRTTPKGMPLSGQNRESFWLAELPIGSEESIAGAIRRANEKLQSSRTYLERLSDSGGQVEYFIGWFFDANTGEMFDWQLLRECADLRIHLQFDVYPRGRKKKVSSKGSLRSRATSAFEATSTAPPRPRRTRDKKRK